MNTQETTLTEQFSTELRESNLIPMFEIPVLNLREAEEDYIIFDIFAQDGKLIAQHEPLNNEEEKSDKIASKVVELDGCFSLDEHLQSLHEECTQAITDSDWFELSDH
jgi:hypothetical protein